MNTERNCQSCKYYKDGYCENLELKPCYPQKGCGDFSKQDEELYKLCWIPVSERLPEIDEPVLIFQRYYEGVNITIGRYHSDEEQGGYRYWQWIKYDNHFSYGIDHFGIICPGSSYVDAWMPLPKPFEPQESEG